MRTTVEEVTKTVPVTIKLQKDHNDNYRILVTLKNEVNGKEVILHKWEVEQQGLTLDEDAHNDYQTILEEHGFK